MPPVAMPDPPLVIVGNALLGTAIVPDIAVSLSDGRIVNVGRRDELESTGSARVLDAGDGIVARPDSSTRTSMATAATWPSRTRPLWRGRWCERAPPTSCRRS